MMMSSWCRTAFCISVFSNVNSFVSVHHFLFYNEISWKKKRQEKWRETLYIFKKSEKLLVNVKKPEKCFVKTEKEMPKRS